jgi:hypothetical protein
MTKYRITIKEDNPNKFRAWVGKENKFGKLNYIALENDTSDLCYYECYYDSVDEAEEACKEYHKKHIEKSDIVKEFEI